MHFVLLTTISLLFVWEGALLNNFEKGQGLEPPMPPPPFCTCLKMCVHSNEGHKIHRIHTCIHLDSNPISHWIKGLCCHLTALGGCKDMSWSPSTSVLPSFCPSYPLNPAVVSHIKPTIQFTYHIQLWAHGVLSSSATMTCKITYSVKEEWKWEKIKWFLLHFLFIRYHGNSWLSNVRSAKLHSNHL